MIPGTIFLFPNYGNQLGGSLIEVILHDLNLKLAKTDRISCVFDNQSVHGVYVDEDRVLCVSPQLHKTGKILFQLTVRNTYIYEAEYNSCKFHFHTF